MARAKSRNGRRQQILEAAAAAFHEKGYEGTSIQDIADRVGMLKGSLYYYITSKEDLLDEILTAAHDVAIELIDEVHAREGVDTAMQMIEWLVRRQLERNLEILPLASAFYTEARHLPAARRREIYKTRSAFEQLFCDLVEAAQKDGEARTDFPPMVLTQVCLASLNSLQLWYDPSRSKFDAKTTSEAYASLLLRALSPE